MSRPPTPQLLPEDVNWDSQQTHKQTRPTKHKHNLLRSTIRNPIIRKVTQTVEHEILEQHVHDEDVVRLTSEGVEAVGERGEDADEDTNHH